jgi:D-glycero-alpha-D-manno-heptose 1-phosphate guanylyltransferase
MNGFAIQDLSMVILAGGLGTRLRSVLPDLPKPMALVNGRPFLEILVAQAARAGFRDVVLCVGYRADAIEAHFGDGRGHGVRMRYAHERELLGTAGAVLNAQAMVGSDPFVVINGDSYCAVDFSRMMAHHRDHRAAATIVAVQVTDSSRYGSLQLEPDGAIAGYNEKAQALSAGWINAGIYLLQRSVLQPLAQGRPASLERDLFPVLVGQRALYAFKTSGMFIDIGIPSELERAQTLLRD